MKMSTNDKEVRVITVGKLELRSTDNKKTMVGYASVFNSMSQDMGFFERVMPGAFARAIKDNQDVRALFNHKEDLVLGRTKSGTLRLKEDNTGLQIECDLPDTTYSRDLQECMSRGDIDQMSFSFRCLTDRWSMQDGKQVRDLMDLDLYDISPVTFPAYTDTSVALRSLSKFQQVPNLDAMRRARLFLEKEKLKLEVNS